MYNVDAQEFSLNDVAEEAWNLYCEETSGGMDVRDSWSQLSDNVKMLYLNKVLKKLLAQKEAWFNNGEVKCD